MNNSIDNRYKYHAPKPGQQDLYEEIRAKGKELAELIKSMGDNREFSVAHTHLETAIMWANAGVARCGIVSKNQETLC